MKAGRPFPEMAEVFGQDQVWVCGSGLVHGFIDCPESTPNPTEVTSLGDIENNDLCPCSFGTPEPDTSKTDRYFKARTELALEERLMVFERKLHRDYVAQGKHRAKANRAAERQAKAEEPKASPAPKETTKMATPKRRTPTQVLEEFFRLYFGWMVVTAILPMLALAWLASHFEVQGVPFRGIFVGLVVVHTWIQLRNAYADWDYERQRHRNRRKRGPQNSNSN